MLERFVLWVDDRLGAANFIRHALRKAFPDHWSFMLGEINVYAFLILLGTGTFLAFFFQPSAEKTIYHGSYALLNGVAVSQAYASALRLSFDVRAGLLVRQIHHWAALIFVAGIVVHMARVFLTGAFRKPRDINWMVGVALLAMAMFEGFSGYSLPDDLLSGTGLHIADSVLLSIPIVGTWASFLLLGGDFPSAAMFARLFVAHVFLLPAAIGGAIALHLAILWRQKHAQFPGPGRTEHNVVGSPLVPTYAVKSLALLAATAATVTGLGTFVQINPIWLFGPYHAWQVLTPAQPDWYIGPIDGALRLSFPWSLRFWGHLIPSPFFPAVLLPGAIFTFLFLWPVIDRMIRRDPESHHLLDRARDVPWRMGLGVALTLFAGGFTLAASSDVQARYLHLSVVTITVVDRWVCVLAPLAGFFIARAICIALRDAQPGPNRVRLFRNANGGFEERPLP